MTSVIGARPSPIDRLVPLPAALVIVGCLGAWPISGRAVAVGLVAVSAISIVAGVIDAKTYRIPNRVAAAGVVAFLVGGVITILGDHRAPVNVAAGALLGVVAGGAPLLALMWLLRPVGVGGGDVKLLTVQGATIGLLAPLAAPLVLLGGVLGGSVFVISARGRRRAVPLAPGLAVGFVLAVVIGTIANIPLGGTYG